VSTGYVITSDQESGIGTGGEESGLIVSEKEKEIIDALCIYETRVHDWKVSTGWMAG
jgi:hypothetical protein